MGDLCTLRTGGTPSRSNPEYFLGGEIRWLVSGDIHQREIHDCEGRITHLGLEHSNARMLPVNSVLIALNGQGKTRGSVALLRTEATCNQSLVSIMPNDASKLLPEFLFHFLDAQYENIRRLTGDDGNDRRGLNMPIIRKIKIPVPPADEQRRIVAVLDEAFEGLARARENAEANLQNAGELFGTILAALVPDGSEGNECPTQLLGEICAFQGGTQPPKSEFIDAPRNGYVRLLQIRDFKSDDKAVYVLDTGKLKKCEATDIMIGRYGASVGQIHRGKAGAYNVALVKTIPDDGQLDRDYFYYFLTSDLFQKPLLAKSSRGAQDGFNQGDIAPFPVPVPPLDEQRRIVALLDEQSENVRCLAAQYQAKLSDLDDLRQSLLQKAFAGELT